MTDEPGAILMLVDEGRTFIGQNTHDFLVIHKTAGGSSAQNIATFFANDPAMASTHYIVGQDGAIVQCVLEKDGAGGNCCLETGHAAYLPLGVNLNVKTVSIEHVDPAMDNSTPLTEAQKAASFRLVHDICTRHNIPMRKGDASGGIIGHHDIAPLSRARCPGNYPMDELFAYLQNGGNALGTPAGWHDDGKTLTAPNGIPVVLGFREYILSHGWDPSNVPLAKEQGVDQVEAAHPELGKGTVLLCVFSGLYWTGTTGVQPLHAGEELAKTRQQASSLYADNQTLRAQIATLQSQVTPIVDPRVAKFEQMMAIGNAV